MKKKKILKWIIIGIPLLVVVGVMFIVGGSYIDHRELVEQEKKEYPAPGILVDVNGDGNELHVYTKGEGNATLVFISGLGTSSPVYDFKVLYNKLSNDYRIAVVERAGYGWSDITSSSRDIDTILEETRTAFGILKNRQQLQSKYIEDIFPVNTVTGMNFVDEAGMSRRNLLSDHGKVFPVSGYGAFSCM